MGGSRAGRGSDGDRISEPHPSHDSPDDASRRIRGGGYLRPVGAALSLGAIFVAVLGFPLDAAPRLGLSAEETSSWILALYGIPSLVSLGLIWRYRQPLLVTGNVFVIIFVLLLGGDLRWEELVGATMVAGVIVLLLGVTGLTDRLSALIPPPIVFGLLAGAVMPFVADLFTSATEATLLVGATFGTYLASQALLGSRVPPILPALLVGSALAVLTGAMGPVPVPAWPVATLTAPDLTLRAVLTAVPVMVVLITLQANVPSIVFLRGQDYDPPERTVALMSGLGTTIGSVFGPLGVSLSLPATALVAGPDAGDRSGRRLAAYIAAGIGVAVAALSGFASGLTEVIPAALLTAVVGLAVVGVLTEAIGQIGRSPLTLGPVFAFAVSLSDLQLLGLGRFFWALVVGLVTSFLVERRAWESLTAGS